MILLPLYTKQSIPFLTLHQDQPIWTSLLDSARKSDDALSDSVDPDWALRFYHEELDGDKTKIPTNLEILVLANEEWKPVIEESIGELLDPCPEEN